ncbi:hypothetical protein FB107DRAFT_276887 [Schizophyllum commune]
MAPIDGQRNSRIQAMLPSISRSASYRKHGRARGDASPAMPSLTMTSSRLLNSQESTTEDKGGKKPEERRPDSPIRWTDMIPPSLSLPSHLDESDSDPPSAPTPSDFDEGQATSDASETSTTPTDGRTPDEADCLEEEAESELGDLFDSVKHCVATAVDTLVDYGPDILQDVLEHSGDLLGLIPVPGLGTAAKTLLIILRETKKVRKNRSECMHLTQRCALLLIDVRSCLDQLGDDLAEELSDAVARVTRKMLEIQMFLTKKNDSAYFTRLKGSSDLAVDIQQYTRQLDAAMASFSTSVKFLMLRQIRVLHANKEKLPASSSWRASELAAQAADLIQRGKIATTSADVTTLFGENFGGPCSSRASSARTMPGNLTVVIPPCEATIPPDCSPCSSTSTEKDCGSRAPSEAPDANPPATPTTPGSPPLQMGVVDTARKVWLGDARTSWLGNPADTTVRYPSLSPAQIARIKARLRGEMREFDMQEKLAELRIFIDLAVQMRGALLDFLAEEGSHIPLALRALSHLRVTELSE